MRRALCLAVGLAVVLLVLAGSSAVAQVEGDQQNDRANPIVEELRQAYLTAYNSHDAEAVAALYAEDADIRYPDGTMLRGRAEILRELEKMFAEHKDVRLAITPLEGRFITRRILLVDAATDISAGPPAIPPRAQNTVIFRREQDNQWRIAAIRMSVPVEQRP